METNFFQQLSDLPSFENIRLNIQKQPDNQLMISLLLTSDSINDNAIQLIPPLVLKGTAIELDEGFFKAIATPIQKTSELITNINAYEKALNTAQKESRQQKDKETTRRKEKESKRKKFEEQMKKVDELEKQKKIGEAIGQLPDLNQFPEFAEEIKKKSQQLRGQHGTLSLFEEPDPENNPEEPSNEEIQEGDDDDFDEDFDNNPDSADNVETHN